MWQAVAIVYAVSCVALLLLFRNSKRPLTPAETKQPVGAEQAFRDAQREAQAAFEDPAMGPHSHEFFWRVMRALDRWEEWQGRRLCTLQDVGADATEVEWHALSLLNSLPPDQPAPYVH